MDVLPFLVPWGTTVHVNDVMVDRTVQEMTVEATAIATSCLCPSCHVPAERIHSHYQRTLADLPWAEFRVRLRLTVRKFFCTNPECPRKVFTEWLPLLAAPSARRTLRLAEQYQHLGLALGGNPSARLSVHLQQTASRNTFLRLVRRLPLPHPVMPEIIGIDDWAWRKGHRYGTIICDLERRCPIALLEDRDADTLAAWLKQYPSIRVIARDRAGVYADGTTRGAPQALQIADRFHLLRNLADTLLPLFEQHAKLLRKATGAMSADSCPLDVVERDAPLLTEELVHLMPPPIPSPKHQAQAELRRAERLARFERAHALYAQGWPIRAIGRELGLNRNTVRVYIRASSFPERQPRVLRQPGLLDPFIPYLIERWNAGCRTGTVLWQEIAERGYCGKRVTVFSFVTRLRRALGIPAKNRTIQDGTVVNPKERPLTPRNAVWLILQRPEKRDEATIERVSAMRQGHPDLESAIMLTEGFATLLRAGNVEKLDSWLEQAASSTLKPFQSFATSLRRDQDAVRAGIEHNWSTGLVEGEINRLKLAKRTMFGRAGFALLQRRVLLSG